MRPRASRPSSVLSSLATASTSSVDLNFMTICFDDEIAVLRMVAGMFLSEICWDTLLMICDVVDVGWSLSVVSLIMTVDWAGFLCVIAEYVGRIDVAGVVSWFP